MYASLKSSHDLSRREVVLIGISVALGAALYLLASKIIYRIGFPLDDSWIHLTYARNLALHRQWAFRLGHPSAGSTSPLWAFLLAPGFWLGLAPYAWTYLLGALLLFGLAVLMEMSARRLLPAYGPKWPWIGFFFALEWHMVWAAMSGMETLLHALLLTSVVVAIMKGSRRFATLGLLSGLSVWVRPDGLTLLPAVAVAILAVERDWPERGRKFLIFLIGFGALFVPYLLFNLWLSGTPMPNTFYAKQAEYAAWQVKPLWYRASVLLVQLLTGPGLILFPGVLGWLLLSLRRRNWPMLIAMLWCAGYFLLYILRLPPYQHGRYLMPAMPTFFLCGLLAFFEFLRSTLFRRRHWIGAAIWQSSLVLITLAFLALGARAYGEDVGLIESEMVVTARWIAQNLPPGAVVAAHDIGALGYWDDHPLIDLAGLVSPQVVPFIRDETRLARFLDQRAAGYLVAFPSFYPQLTRRAQPLFVSGGRFAPSAGEDNMTVYRWASP